MVGREVTPTDIGKHSKLIKAAQEEMSTMDVLVCGKCLNVFHYIEEFKLHKLKQCFKENTNVRECNDTKPKIWAFLLWKATQLANNKESNSNQPNSWSLYQTWVKMDDSIRETWIVAGKTIQSFAKVSQGGLQEMPVKITKTVVNNNSDVSPGRKPLTQTKPQVANLKPPLKMVQNKKADSENDTSPLRSAAIATGAQSAAAQKNIKKPISAGTPIINKGSITISPPANKGRRAKRTMANSSEIVDDNVEKIVAKRFNPRRQMHEYLVKWEGTQVDQNTWEPAIHLENVPHLLETFEKQLARQKETRAAMQAKQQAMAAGKKEPLTQAGKTPINTALKLQTDVGSDGGKSNLISSPAGSDSRPTRSSKLRAMDQVKQWVTGSHTGASASPSSADESALDPTTGTLAGVKRKLDDSDFNDSNASDFAATPTATMEDLEEDLIPSSHIVKRSKNGSVEVKTNDTKIVKVNGNTSRNSSFSGESVPVGPNSAEVIITQDSNSSGVVKKPGFSSSNTQKSEAQIRVLSKGESAVSNTGIVRLSGGTTRSGISSTESTPETKTVTRSIQQQIRTVAGRQTPSGTTITQRQVVQRTANVSSLNQRRTISGGTPQRTTGMQSRSGIQQSSPSSGRMIIPRQASAYASRPGSTTKTVTPEQKILQLSKSGDLKVTKKVMTREESQQRLTPQQRQQQLLRQQQMQKAQLQKAASVRKPSESYDDHQAQLCPITGKILGPDGQPLDPQPSPPEEQQELQGIDPTLLLTGDQQMLTNEDGTPLLVTGEDGTVYQVAGKNAEGQTILVTQGPDGEQQFAYVAAAEGEENPVLTLDNAVAEAVSQMPSDQQGEAASEGGSQYLVKTTQEDGTTQVVTMTEAELAQHQAMAAAQQGGEGAAVTGASGQLCIQTGGEGGDGQEANIPAEVVQADLPSPGGTRRVVLLLQDGTFMMTEMHDDEFKALNIAA